MIRKISLAVGAMIMVPCLANADGAALEFRTFPEGPIYPYKISHGLHASDIVLHNLAIMNRSTAPLTVGRITFSVVSDDKTLIHRAMERDELEVAAERFYRNGQYGVFNRLPQLFGHDQMFDSGEKLSATPLLEPKTALIAIQSYLAYQGDANALRISVDYAAHTETPQAKTETFTIPIRRYESPNIYRLPLKERWYVLAGPNVSDHHRGWQNTEFAYDFSRTDDGGLLFSNKGFAPSDYHAYGQPVFAASDGVVVKAIDRFPEAPLREEGESIAEYQRRMSDRMNENFSDTPDANYGNIVVIEHESGEFSSYTHLKQGSILVTAGNRVASGDPLGKVGQSGNSLRPHLHFAVTLASGRSVPVTFGNALSVDGEVLSRVLKTGEFVVASDQSK